MVLFFRGLAFASSPFAVQTYYTMSRVHEHETYVGILLCTYSYISADSCRLDIIWYNNWFTDGYTFRTATILFIRFFLVFLHIIFCCLKSPKFKKRKPRLSPTATEFRTRSPRSIFLCNFDFTCVFRFHFESNMVFCVHLLCYCSISLFVGGIITVCHFLRWQ